MKYLLAMLIGLGTANYAVGNEMNHEMDGKASGMPMSEMMSMMDEKSMPMADEAMPMSEENMPMASEEMPMIGDEAVSMDGEMPMNMADIEPAAGGHMMDGGYHGDKYRGYHRDGKDGKNCPWKERKRAGILKFLGWMTVVNFGLLLYWWGMIAFAHDWVYKMHSRWFKISQSDFDNAQYKLMGMFKLLFFIFNLVPYLVLRGLW